MPTYEYACRACGYEFEEYQSITAPVKRKCPKCGKVKLERLIGTGAGILFKGGGFYQTDYRSDGYKKAAEAEKKSAEPAGEKNSEVRSQKAQVGEKKPDTKGEAKPTRAGKSKRKD
jgi:putative FmdB family regulatory protein